MYKFAREICNPLLIVFEFIKLLSLLTIGNGRIVILPKVWRRSYDVAPPPVDEKSEYYPANDPKYKVVVITHGSRYSLSLHDYCCCKYKSNHELINKYL